MEMLILLFCMLMWGSIGVFARFIPASSLMIIGWRAIIALPLLILLTKSQLPNWKLWLSQRNGKSLIFNGMLIALNWILLFEAFKQTTIANATVTYYMGPIFMIIFSRMIFNKQITWSETLTCLLAFSGLIIIIASNLSISIDHLPGLLLGLGAGICYGFIVASNATIKDIPYQSMTTIQIMTSAIIAVLLISINESTFFPTLSPAQWVLLTTLGLIHTGTCYSLYYYILPKIKLTTIAVVSYLDPLSAILFGLIFFKEQIIGWQWLGVILVLLSPIISKIITPRQTPAPTPDN
jgi:drug/metabolite transporter (DMT)-like permease